MSMVQSARYGLAKLLSRVIPPGLMSSVDHFEFWQDRGYHVTRVDYYQVVPDTRRLGERIWEKPSEMLGVDLDEPGQLRLLEDLAGTSAEEWEQLLKIPDMHMDWLILHGMIRKYRPRRVIEVGSGLSTQVIASALVKNRQEFQVDGTLMTIDPYPSPLLTPRPEGLTEVRVVPVQEVPFQEFEKLEANDVLFIDSSHVSQIGSDVNYEILEVLPRLKEGVIVHIHDIYLPYEYLRFWAMERKIFWNEAYLLQAFLTLNSSFQVRWSAYAMTRRHPDRLAALLPDFNPEHTPSSFWIQRVRA